MPTIQKCPDCGGIIGAERTTADGHPCTCIAPPPASGDTIDEVTEQPITAEHGKPKVCCNCGKDLTGRSRYKDSLGYWCKDCHRQDKARRQAAETRCPDCGRLRPIDKMVTFEGRSICPTCHKDALKVAEKHAHKAEAAYRHKQHEKSRLIVLVVILAVLGLVIVLSQFGLI